MSQASPKWMKVTGIVLSALPGLGMILSGVIKQLNNPGMTEKFTHVFGYPASLSSPIGLVEILCAVLFIVPRTAVLGAILTTGYLGGAVATHVRVQDYGSAIAPLFLGIFVWAGLFLRDERLRELLPLRETA